MYPTFICNKLNLNKAVEIYRTLRRIHAKSVQNNLNNTISFTIKNSCIKKLKNLAKKSAILFHSFKPR